MKIFGSEGKIKYFFFCLVLIAVIIISIGIFEFHSKKQICRDDCNIILISVDSLRTDHIGAYGYKRDTTPNFDKLAKQGTLFANYYSSSYLTPISEMAVHTGLYPTSSGLTNFDITMSEDRPTMAQYLARSGYDTNAIISSPEFTGNLGLKDSFSRGFANYYYNPQITQISDGRKYPDASNVEKIINKPKQTGQKTFLWLALGGVHWPFGQDAPNYYAKTNYHGVLAGKKLDLQLFMNIYNNFYYDKTHSNSSQNQISSTNKVQLTEQDKDYIIDMYDNGVKDFDNYLGQIIAQLAKSGQDKRTIIIIQSEHGESLGEHGYYAHYDLYDKEVHVPLLIVDPRHKIARKDNQLSGSVDVLPTLLSLVGVQKNTKLQGKNLFSKELHKNNQNLGAAYIERIPLWEEAVLGPGGKRIGAFGFLSQSTGARDIAIRTERWKYIDRLSAKRIEEISVWKQLTGTQLVMPKAELYDLINDPKEEVNVVSKYPDVAAKLKKQLDKWDAGINSDVPKGQPKRGVVQPYR